MTLRRITSGARADFRPLGADGIVLYSVAERLRAVVARRLGPEAAGILAVPQASESGERIDWHTTLEGPVRRLLDAEPAEQQAVRAALADADHRFQALADRLAAGSGEEQGYARLLRLALRHPGDAHVFIVGDRPVVSFWGFAPLSGTPAPRLAPPETEPGPPPAPWRDIPDPPPTRRFTPLALLPLLTLGWCVWAEPLPVCPAGTAMTHARVVLLVDVSGSMRLPMTPEAIALYRRVQAGDVLAGAQMELLMRTTPESAARIGAARSAVAHLVDGLPRETDIGLVTFGHCRGAKAEGIFDRDHRDDLRHTVAAMNPEMGTPLADGLRQAGMLAGDGPAVITLISDGEESCQGDPCARARALKAANPRLTVNVVDLSGDAAARCVAEATGGSVFTPSTLADFQQSIGQAATCSALPQEPS